MSASTAVRPAELGAALRRTPAAGAALALLAAIAIFSVTTDTFLELDNLSLVVQQSLVIGTLALGQTLIILTGGIDLGNAAAAVLATLVMAQLVLGGLPGAAALPMGIGCTVLIGLLVGGLVTRLRLPPFIVTLGMLTMLTAAALSLIHI